MKLVLASASAARRALLEAAGLEIEVRPVALDEAAVKQAARAEGADVADTAILLADLKAARAERDDGALVIGCDQILVCDGRWFDKPADCVEAREHLAELRGRTHELITAVICRRGGRLWHHVARPRLAMRAFSDRFLDRYLDAEGPALLRTVGGYRMEGRGVQLFDQVDGEHAAILGMPLLSLLGFLRQHGAVDS